MLTCVYSSEICAFCSSGNKDLNINHQHSRSDMGADSSHNQWVHLLGSNINTSAHTHTHTRIQVLTVLLLSGHFWSWKISSIHKSLWSQLKGRHVEEKSVPALHEHTHTLTQSLFFNFNFPLFLTVPLTQPWVSNTWIKSHLKSDINTFFGNADANTLSGHAAGPACVPEEATHV